MSPRDLRVKMWTEALRVLQRAEELHCQFFQPDQSASGQCCWEPPIDIIETENDYVIVVALPGVAADEVTVTVSDSAIRISATRRLPIIKAGDIIHRIEIPHGRFTRQIELPATNLAVDQHDLTNGCLMLRLRKH
jgi:HSP20 family molecular chaperone IbpA